MSRTLEPLPAAVFKRRSILARAAHHYPRGTGYHHLISSSRIVVGRWVFRIGPTCSNYRAEDGAYRRR
jgi:hypothetical protein